MADDEPGRDADGGRVAREERRARRTSGSGLPGLYQDYVGHDNNRDGYMVNMIESRVLEHFWRQWEPHIIYVFHQTRRSRRGSGCRRSPSRSACMRPAIISREINMIGMAIAAGTGPARPGRRHAHGHRHSTPGIPGYVDYAPVFKNIPAFWTETAGNQAARATVPLNDLSPAYRDLRPQSLYSSPWPARLVAPGGRGELQRDGGDLDVSEYAREMQDSLLYNRYQAGRDQIAKGEDDGAVRGTSCRSSSATRWRQSRCCDAWRLAASACRSWRRRRRSTARATRPARGWCRPTRSSRRWRGRCSTSRKYPDLRRTRADRRSGRYDAAGLDPAAADGRDGRHASEPLEAEVRAKMAPLGAAGRRRRQRRPPATWPSPTDAAPFDSVPGIGFDSDRAAAADRPAAGPHRRRRLRAAGRSGRRTTRSGRSTGPGSRAPRVGLIGGAPGARYAISGLSESAQAELVKSLALVAERSSEGGAPIKKPRIGLFQPWSGSMDEGWTRWLLERYDFDFVVLHPEDFRTPLTGRIDVVILADDVRIPTAGASGGARGGGHAGRDGRGPAVGAPPGTPPGGAARPCREAARGRGAGGGARVVRPECATR
ncbi:MAG: hypothetical protein MZV65_01100 [Chromatiales bacterium]|nr:hypothetical protein [Chromatiales bacterium]